MRLWLFFMYIYKENLTKLTLAKKFTPQNSYFGWKKNQSKKSIKTFLFNKKNFLQLLAKHFCNLSSFDKVKLHHNKHNIIIHNFLHFLLLFLNFLELHVLLISLESLRFFIICYAQIFFIIFKHWSFLTLVCVHNLSPKFSLKAKLIKASLNFLFLKRAWN